MSMLLFLGDTVAYQSTMILSHALSQYLVFLSKLPGSLCIPPDKEDDILKFVVMSLEVRQQNNK